jgi:hypothetical protein
LLSPTVYDQAGFRGRNDDGDEATATWKQPENTNWSQAVDENFRVRFVVDDTAYGNVISATQIMRLQRRLNAGTWTNVDAASAVVRIFASPNEADSAATTRQLTSGVGDFEVGQFDEGNGLSNISPGGDSDCSYGRLSEVEHCMQIISTDVVDSDVIELRMIHQTGELFALYSQVPSITVSEGGAAAVIPDLIMARTRY